jgi:site-specific DNA recombinase
MTKKGLGLGLAVGYCRVSTDEQDVSLEAQEEQIRAMAVVKGWKLTDVVVDKAQFSGDMDREGLQRVLEMVRKREVEAVIIAKLDRLTRSTLDVIHLVKLFNQKKVALVSLGESLDTKSSMGRFFVRMLASLGELERETIGDRTRTAMGHMRKMGLPVGHAPYGYRAPKAGSNLDVPISQKLPLVMDRQEQALLRRIVQLREKEELSLRKIAARLNKEGIKTRGGSAWKHQYIDKLLRRIEAQA